MPEVIKVQNLVKKYGNFAAVDGNTFHVNKGEIFGLLGENGAGKTTTLEIIEGLRKPTSGEVKVLGFDVEHELDKIKNRIGVQLQSSAYFNFLSLKEILELFGGFYDKKIHADELLKMVDLTEKSGAFVGSLSGGQKQRFSIVASLVNDPDIIFLDEPTTGLDPVARRNLWELIAEIKKRGKTVVLTTHYMEEAEVLCDRIAIMDQGKILVMGETHELIENTDYPFKVSFISQKIDKEAEQKIEKMGKFSGVGDKNNYYEFRFKNRSDLNEAIKLAINYEPEDLNVTSASLEDLFIELTGKRIAE